MYFRPLKKGSHHSICNDRRVARLEEWQKTKKSKDQSKLLRLTVHCSSQTANKTQKFAANVCGIPYSKAGFVSEGKLSWSDS